MTIDFGSTFDVATDIEYDQCPVCGGTQSDICPNCLVDTCAANSSSGCQFGPYGPNQEIQCRWCGKTQHI